MRYIIIAIFLAIVTGCSNKPETCKIAIQPFDNFDNSLIDSITTALKQVYGFDIIILPSKPIPKYAFINVKSPRYRADKLIVTLKKEKPDSVDFIIGLTCKDISITKNDKFGRVKKPESKYKDYGIFGLGYCPGPSCIISIFRLQNTSNKNFILRLKKITVHELGHNLGLKHCESELCLMRDANETIKTIDSVCLKLCDTCLKKINYRLPKIVDI